MYRRTIDDDSPVICATVSDFGQHSPSAFAKSARQTRTSFAGAGRTSCAHAHRDTSRLT
jgi:hypothetical protein